MERRVELFAAIRFDLIGRSVRNVGSHGDEVLHGWRL
jgi:hypothetical protein